VYLAQIAGMQIMVPPWIEQCAIAERVELCTHKIIIEEECCGKLHLLKTALMEDLLTGRVRTTHLEPAK
jgi:hypothetical protein